MKHKSDLIAYLGVLVVGVIDYLIGTEAASSILYLIPIYLLARKRSASSRASVLFIAGVCSMAWLGVDQSLDHQYSSSVILLWNFLVRAGTFFLFAFTFHALYRKNERLQYLNQEKNKFIGIAAHDLRGPVGNILTLSELILNAQNKRPDKNLRELVALIRTISGNTLQLLNNLLDISEIESGTFHATCQPQDYLAFLKEVISINQLLATKKQQKIVLDSKLEFLLVSFDATYLSQVLNNLLSNASKYSPPDTTITVRVEQTIAYVETSVTDQGMGIPPTDRQKIFRPFVKGQNVPTGGERATGLGLAIVRKIIEEHQGELWLESEYGKGSTFYFKLPLSQEAVSSETRTDTPQSSSLLPA